ncbi:MAG TPA: GGDEF domain-containing protein [Gemmatimonadaceae bacterium]
MFGSSPQGSRAGMLNNAEIVVWQSSRRLLFATAVGSVAALLRFTGMVAGPVWPILVIVPAYIALVAVLTVVLERRQKVTRIALVILSVADVAVIFTTVAYVTAPAFYARALLLSLLALQFTQLFFGRTPALSTVGAAIVGYVVLLFAAWSQGVGIGWSEQGWMLAIFILVALNGIALHASANRRLAMLVDLFASAQRGDFSRAFAEDKGREPDGITTLGNAYNHLRSELATMVHTDPLTGCLNRRGLDQVLSQAVSAASRRGGELSLLAIDIDHFKAINDTLGHLGGDSVLRELVELLMRSSRGGDVVARVGGEEFIVLLPDADNEMAGVVAERITSSVRAHGFRTGRGRIRVTVSVGIASEQVADAHIAGSLRARADEALYVAKRLGRDRVVMWAPGIRSHATPPWTDFAEKGLELGRPS